VKLSRELTEFCARLGHDFARPELITRALTHSSLSSATRPDNQRLEFLGDRVLGLVIAAVYMDGGFEAARAMVLRLWGDRVAGVAEDARDAKTALQEWAQARGMAPPVYTEISRSGPDHAPVFRVEARLADGTVVQAEGRVKRQAEQAAARALLDRMERG
jgi:ribonuclease-3